jgi:ketosteroid isomerase-like protein
MTPHSSETGTPSELVRDFYNSWKRGHTTLDETRLRSFLASDVELEGPLAGRTQGVETYVAGLKRFAQGVTDLRILRMIAQESEVAVLFECDLVRPKGTFRFAEFLQVAEGRIRRDQLVFDTVEFRRAAPPTSQEA